MYSLPGSHENAGATIRPSAVECVRDLGFGMTVVELMIVIAIGLVITGIALPRTMTGVKSYHLHSDISSLASYLNLARMRAASQYAPYSLDLDPTTNTYVLERLSAIQYNPIATSTSSAVYSSQSPPAYEYGTQYLSNGETLASCLPGGLSARPGPIAADPSNCGGAFQAYFNTRGMPVDSTGSSLANGGLAIYVTGPNGLTDAVTISPGGAVQTWNWDPGNARWYER